MEIIDIHAHVLPGVDDGPEDIEGTVALLRAAWEGGVRTIVATPHMFSPAFDNNDSWFMGRLYYELLESLDRIGRVEETAFINEMTVFLGAENLCSPPFLEALEQRKVVTLKNTEYLLIEFLPSISAPEVLRAAQRVIEHGYLPVLAHIERYPSLLSSATALAELRALGCRTQVNARSLLGLWPNRQRRQIMTRIHEGLVDLVASDAHDAVARPPRLGEAAKALRQQLPAERVESLLRGEAARILGLASATEPIPAPSS